MWPHFSTYKNLQNWNFEPVHTSYTFRWKSEYEFWLRLNLRIMWRVLKATWLQLAKTRPSQKPSLRYKKVNENGQRIFCIILNIKGFLWFFYKKSQTWMTNTILWQKWKVAYFVSPYFVRGFLFWTILDIWNNKISRRPYFLRGQILYNYR